MRRKLLTKIQKITPNYSAKTSAFSNVIVINADSEELLEKKGNIYCVFSISSSTEIDTSVTTKIIQDYLHDTYYQTESISPTQSIEKCLAEIKDKVIKITNDPATELNIICGVLWGNVFYYVLYGAGTGYLVREGQDKNINPNSEGRFSSASGLIKDQDVIILATQKFADEYSPAKLLNTSISIQNLTPISACLMIKIVVETGFSTEETLNLKPINRTKSNKTPTPVPAKKIKYAALLIPSLIGLLIIGLGIFILLDNNKSDKDKKETKPKVSETSQSSEVKGTAVEAEQIPEVANKDLQKSSEGTKSVDTTVFYDLKIADADIAPSEIIFYKDKLIVSDNSRGKLFISSAETPKFEAAEISVPNIRNLDYRKTLITFIDNNGFNIFDPANLSIVQTYKTNLGKTGNYLDFVYSNIGSGLYRYSVGATELEKTLWGENIAFTNMKSITIAINVYILTQDGNVKRFSKGVDDGFTLKGLTSKLADPIKILTDLDYENLYVLDKVGRISVFDKDGNFKTHIVHTSNTAWKDLKDFSLNAAENKAAILDGTKVYNIDL